MTIVVTVQTPAEIAERMTRLAAEADRVMTEGMHDALNGQVRTEIIRRTPLATVRRYAYNYSADGKKRTRKKNSEGVSGHIKELRNSFRVEIKGDRVDIGHHCPYAIFVHDGKRMPAEGEYWTPQTGRGWTTKGTGSHFISAVLEAHADEIPELASRGIEKRLRDRGII